VFSSTNGREIIKMLPPRRLESGTARWGVSPFKKECSGVLLTHSHRGLKGGTTKERIKVKKEVGRRSD